jgi:hypothetical protein
LLFNNHFLVKINRKINSFQKLPQFIKHFSLKKHFMNFNRNANYYIEYCDNLFQNWLQHQFKDDIILSQLFQMDYAPEPYFTLREGKQPLYVLLTNPGTGMEFQHISHHKNSNYEKFSASLTQVYTSDDFKKGKGSNPAYRRLMKSIDFANFLGYDGVVNIETIPFHSPNLDKNKALKAIQQSKTLLSYQEHLKSYLSDKPVLIVSACHSNHSISIDTINKSKWLSYQCELAGIVIKDLEMEALTKKNEKVSSASFKKDNKHIVLMMGSNNLPSIKSK